MASLRQLLAAHAPLLILDAASSRIQVGGLFEGGGAEWQMCDEEAGVGIFQCLDRLSLRVDQARAYVFCEGPGSILGIHTTAMAVRTWCTLRPLPVFRYSSLALVAESQARPDIGVIADARRDSWHHFQLGRGLRRIAATDLTGELVMPENFRHWSALPLNVRVVPYSLADLLSRTLDADLFQPTSEPDAFLHEEPSYVTWSPQIHRAP